MASPTAQAAQKAYTGAYSGALNNVNAQEASTRAVAQRRQADASKYQAYVMGQQGKFAAAQMANDNASNQATQQNQAFTLAAQKALQGGLDKHLNAQGVPTAPNAGGGPLVADQQRVQALLGGAAQQQLQTQKANQDRNGFLAAANNAALLANRQQIRGDEYNQLQTQEATKTGILGKKTELAASEKSQATQLAATKANSDANRALQEKQMAATSSNEATNRAFQAQQNKLDRGVRLKTSANALQAVTPGYQSPTQKAASLKNVNALDKQLNEAHNDALFAATHAPTVKNAGDPTKKLAAMISYLGLQHPDADPATLRYAAAQALGLKPPKGKPANYYSHEYNALRGKALRGQAK